jgi:hypothetical protein
VQVVIVLQSSLAAAQALALPGGTEQNPTLVAQPAHGPPIEPAKQVVLLDPNAVSAKKPIPAQPTKTRTNMENRERAITLSPLKWQDNILSRSSHSGAERPTTLR